MSKKEKLTLAEFQYYRFTPVIPVADLFDLRGRKLAESFPYWRKYELLPFLPKGSWNLEISMAQLIWLRILDYLRALSFEVKDIQIVCDYLFKDAYTKNLPQKVLLELYDSLKKKETARTLDDEDAALLNRVEYILKQPVLQYALKLEINHLTELISWCIENREDAALLIYRDGKVVEQRGQEFKNKPSDNFSLQEPHIRLSMMYFLDEFVEKEELLYIVSPVLLTEDEQFVLSEIKRKNVAELNIKLGDGTIRIDSTEFKTLDEARSREIRHALGLANYEEVTVSTKDAKKLTFKKTKKTIKSRNPGSH